MRKTIIHFGLILKLFLDLVSSPPAVVTTCVACVDVSLGIKMREMSRAVHVINICVSGLTTSRPSWNF